MKPIYRLCIVLLLAVFAFEAEASTNPSKGKQREAGVADNGSDACGRLVSIYGNGGYWDGNNKRFAVPNPSADKRVQEFVNQCNMASQSCKATRKALSSPPAGLNCSGQSNQTAMFGMMCPPERMDCLSTCLEFGSVPLPLTEENNKYVQCAAKCGC